MSNLVNPYKGAFGKSIDPVFAAVGLLLHMEGSNAGTSFTDSSSNGHTVTPTSATTSTTQQKFGSTSCKLATAGGGTNQLSIPHHTSLDFPTGDFSLEAWVFLTTLATNQIVLQKATGSGFYPWQLFINTSNILVFRGFNSSDSSAYTMNSTTALTANTWHFLQARRFGNVFSMAINGNVENSVTAAVTLKSASDPVIVGNNNNNALIGYIDEVRISKGYAVAFTNRSSQFPDS